MALIVGGERIDDSEIQREVERLRPHHERVFKDKDSKERQTQLYDWCRENVIEKVLLNQQAKKSGMQIPQQEVERLFEETTRQCGGPEQLHKLFETDDETKIKEQMQLNIKVHKLLEDACRDLPAPSNEAVGRFYEQNKEQFKSAEQVRVAHIVKYIGARTDEETAHSIMRKAQDELSGGAIFEMLVSKYSDCLENGGDLGYITRGQMVEEFEDVAFNLAVDQVSGVFRSRFGFHIAKVYDRKPSDVVPLEDVKDLIVKELEEQIRDKAVDEYIDHLKSQAEIEQI